MSSAPIDDDKVNRSSIPSDELSLQPLLPFRTTTRHDAAVRSMICRMFAASHALKLDVETRFTAVVLWHRYYAAVVTSKGHNVARALASSSTSDIMHEDASMVWEAAACLFLACKVEERPRRLQDIIKVAQLFLKRQPESLAKSVTAPNHKTDLEALSASAQNDVSVQEEAKLPAVAASHVPHVVRGPHRSNEVYWDNKKLLVRSEQIVLRWLGFDVMVSKPHTAASMVLKAPTIQEQLLLAISKDALDQLSSIVWRRLDDVLFHSLSLHHSALELACAAIVLAVDELRSTAMPSSNYEEVKMELTSSAVNPTAHKTENASPSSKGRWWNLVGVSDRTLEDTKNDLVLAKSQANKSIKTEQSI